ncbi:hypothetical protein D3C71_1429540 [compost metagenome]
MGCCFQWRHVRLEEPWTRTTRQLPVVGQLLVAIDFFDSRRIPLQFQCITPLFGLPVTVRDHGHAFSSPIERYAEHRLHAFDGACRAVI